MRGFTLTEILIALFILAIMLGFAVPAGLNLLRTEQLSTATDDVIQTLRRAESFARSQENDSKYGVFFTASDYTLFQGDFFASSTPFQVFNLLGGVTASTNLTGDEVVFEKLSGRPNNMGSITLTSGSSSETIEINSIGRIALLSGAPPPPPATCSGIPTVCTIYSDQTSCQNQGGCAWGAAFCSGTYGASCSVFTKKGQCQSQTGCTWNNASKICSGNYTANCGDDFSDLTSCQAQTGCTWNPETCSGTATTCDTYTDSASCIAQAGCAWE